MIDWAVMPTWSEARSVAWEQWPGSAGSDQDIAGALETLRFGTDADADDFCEAWTQTLYSAAWAQGTLYPLAAPILPFVLEIIEQSPALATPCAARREIAVFVACCADSARRALADERGDATSARAVQAALTALAHRLRAWLGTDLGSIALATMLNLPKLQADVLAGAFASTDQVVAAILGHHRFVAPELLRRASFELSRFSTHPVLERASHLLANADARLLEANAGRLAALSTALHGEGKLEQRLDALRDVFGIVTSSAVPGESSATVTITDDDWFVVQAQRKTTVRWPAHPFVEGDTVILVDISDKNCPRQVRGTGNKAHLAANFDSAGRFGGLL